jgi:hypothetical protein
MVPFFACSPAHPQDFHLAQSALSGGTLAATLSDSERNDLQSTNSILNIRSCHTMDHLSMIRLESQTGQTSHKLISIRYATSFYWLKVYIHMIPHPSNIQ